MTVWAIVDSADYSIEIFLTEEDAWNRYNKMTRKPYLYSPVRPQKIEIPIDN